ncbi:MAG: LPS export ABC transporter periplasmic protein LptC [Burkholderiales bacterium]|nr:LPS export ABC transporter periplasmic protein LptC [Burkholderiales bacterium]
MTPSRLSIQDQVRAAVPMVLVAGLAAFTWWLVQSAPKLAGPDSVAKVSSAPDYELHQARVERYNAQGRLMAILDGQDMRHFADGDRLEIDAVQLSARNEEGQRVHAVAREGLANGVAEVVVLQGGAHVVATPASVVTVGKAMLGSSPIVFEGERLQIDTRERRISASQPIKVTNAQGQVTAGEMTHDERTGITQLSRQVRGHYDAPAR